MNIVVDTNVFISALLKTGVSRVLIVLLNHNLLFPEFVLDEIEEHKEEILAKSGLTLKDFRVLMLTLLKHVKVIRTEKVAGYKSAALKIVEKIDADDAIFFATALAFDAVIWSDDKKLKTQKKINVLNTAEILDLAN